MLRRYLGLVGFFSIAGLLYLPTQDLAWLGFFGFSGWFVFFAMAEEGAGRPRSDFDRSARNGFIVAMAVMTLVGAVITVGFLLGGVQPPSALVSLNLLYSLLLVSLVTILLVSLLAWGISMIYYHGHTT
jgi:hypothetical protein